jgi:hypothetical protein
MTCAPTATRTRDVPLRKSFYAVAQPAASLVRACLLVVWLPLNVSGFHLVLARGWHGARLSMRITGVLLLGWLESCIWRMLPVSVAVLLCCTAIASIELIPTTREVPVHRVPAAMAAVGGRAALFAAAIMVVACSHPLTPASHPPSHAATPPASRPATPVAATTHPTSAICYSDPADPVCVWANYAVESQPWAEPSKVATQRP